MRGTIVNASCESYIFFTDIYIRLLLTNHDMPHSLKVAQKWTFAVITINKIELLITLLHQTAIVLEHACNEITFVKARANWRQFYVTFSGPQIIHRYCFWGQQAVQYMAWVIQNKAKLSFQFFLSRCGLGSTWLIFLADFVSRGFTVLQSTKWILELAIFTPTRFVYTFEHEELIMFR
jgi:hypothetical protein